MNSDWTKLYSDTNSIRMHLLKTTLSEEGIPSTLLDKKDSSYGGSFGDIELYVPNDFAEAAQQLLEDFLSHGS